jgi:kinesin family protein 15
MVEQVKVEDRRASLGFPVTPKAGDKRSKSPFKGGGSPFKCMGKGLSQQMNSELDAELSAHQRRIEELDALATSRQKEVGCSSFLLLLPET